jgi:hypothetical protein
MRYKKFLIVFAVLILSSLLAIQINAGPKGQGKGKGPKPLAPVQQTGQTSCYAADGSSVPCDGTGQGLMLVFFFLFSPTDPGNNFLA